MLHNVDKSKVEVLRAMNAGRAARLVRANGTTRVVPSLRATAKGRPIQPVLVNWLKRNRMVVARKREGEAVKGEVLTLTLKGVNYAVRETEAAGRGGARRVDRAKRKPDQPAVKTLILQTLQKAGDKGMKVIAIKEILLTKYRIATHEKTVGMSLYRFANPTKKGEPRLARRSKTGNVWFAVLNPTSKSVKPRTHRAVAPAAIQPDSAVVH